MGQLVLVWNGTPRWLRGWFLGNIFYVLLSIIGWKYELAQIVAVLPAFIIPFMPYLSSHLIWCVVGAIFIGWLGEKRGISAIILISVIGLIIFGLLLIWAVSQWCMMC